MKASFPLVLASLSLLTMSNSCHKEEEVAPSDLVTGRILRVEQTFDQQLANPRTRWVVDLAPLSLPGKANQLYAEAKVFGLGDTAVYRVGRTVQFHSQLVPYAQQTSWKTRYEYYNMAATAPWTEPRPEIVVTDVRLTSGL
jgi:hypothetical protein